MLEEGIGGRFDLPGEALDGTQLAAALAEALERPVRYEAITPAAFGEALRPYLGDHAALGTAGVYEMSRSTRRRSRPRASCRGWAPRSVQAWARDTFAGSAPVRGCAYSTYTGA